MPANVLSSDQIEQFIQRGYIHLPEAFPPQQALAVQDVIWERLSEYGIYKTDPAIWTQPLVHLKENYQGPVFEACMTARLAQAIEELVGPGRWKYRDVPQGWGWWPVNFHRGVDQPWTVPQLGWHWDGGHFRHYLHSPDQGVLLLCIFLEIAPRGGGTLVAEGSHQIVARILSQHPAGLELMEAVELCSRSHPWLAELTGALEAPSTLAAEEVDKAQREKAAKERIARFMYGVFRDEAGTALRVVEMTASPGDVFLCHPFLYHAASLNHLRVPRFLCNRTTPLKEPMNFNRATGEYSVVERSIRQAVAQGSP
jgi:hypothetical protein